MSLAMKLLRSVSKGISIIGHNFASVQASATITLNVPTGTVAGDILVIMLNNYLAKTWTLPAGWVLSSGGSTAGTMAYKISSGETSVLCTLSAATEIDGVIVSVRNADFDVFGVPNTDTAPTQVVNGVTVSANNSILFAMFSNRNISISYTTPTGMSILNADSDATNPSQTIFYKEKVVAGATGDILSTPSAAVSTVYNIAIALKPKA